MPRLWTFLFFVFLIGCGKISKNNAQTLAEANSPLGVIDDNTEGESPNFSTPNPCADPELIDAIPQNSSSLSGQQITSQLQNLQGPQRDKKIMEKLMCGHSPSFLTELKPIITNYDNDTIILCVSPDYLLVGNDSDGIRFPLGLPATKKILGEFGFILPTRKIVDLIYQQSQTKLAPSFKQPGPQMESTAYIVSHNTTIDAMLSADPGLIGGHKKDIVISNRLNTRPGKIAIYGWHRLNGKPVQPLSTVHHKNYADYSHGIRLVSQIAFVNGKKVHIKNLLTDLKLSQALSDEGPLSPQLLDQFKSTGLSCNLSPQ